MRGSLDTIFGCTGCDRHTCMLVVPHSNSGNLLPAAVLASAIAICLNSLNKKPTAPGNMVHTALPTSSATFCLVGKSFTGHKPCSKNTESRTLLSAKVWCFEGGATFVRDKIFPLV